MGRVDHPITEEEIDSYFDNNYDIETLSFKEIDNLFNN